MRIFKIFGAFFLGLNAFSMGSAFADRVSIAQYQKAFPMPHAYETVDKKAFHPVDFRFHPAHSLLIQERVIERLSPECPEGGVKLRLGLDLNSDELLEAAEVQGEQNICGTSLDMSHVTYVGTTPIGPGPECDLGGHSVNFRRNQAENMLVSVKICLTDDVGGNRLDPSMFLKPMNASAEREQESPVSQKMVKNTGSESAVGSASLNQAGAGAGR